MHNLPLDNSVYGPPTNLRITPDGRLGLVASSVLMQQEGTAWYAHADNGLHVIDLTATPPRLIETIEVGRQPSGIAISNRGDLALVANREGRSVTVLSITGLKVRPVATIDVCDEAAAVAIAPYGRRAFVAKNKAPRLGVLAIEDTAARYKPGQDIPVGAGIDGLGVTPDGTLALAADTGQQLSDGHADTVSVIRPDGRRPVVIDHLGIGDTPEALVIGPDGRHAAVSVVWGSSASHGSPGYTPNGAVALPTLSPQGARITSWAEAVPSRRASRSALLASTSILVITSTEISGSTRFRRYPGRYRQSHLVSRTTCVPSWTIESLMQGAPFRIHLV